jgi:isopenicillin-N epimerase
MPIGFLSSMSVAASILSAPSLIAGEPGKINLNAGSLHPTPLAVLQRLMDLRTQLAAQPADFCNRQMPALLTAAREQLAAYLNVRPADLLLLPNVTVALNLVVSSLTLLRGTEVMLMDHQYGSMNFLWERWAGVRDWSLRTIEVPFEKSTTPEDIIEAVSRQLSSSTRVLFLYHVTSPTGLVVPVKELCALARERDILTVVDGAHAPGMVGCDLSEIGADFYGANTHKWLMGPANGGFLYCQPHRRLELRALITSWGHNYLRSEAFADSGNGGSNWQWDLEFHGTIDRTPIAVLPDVLNFRQSLGGDAVISARMKELARYARQAIPLPVASPDHPDLCGALTVFALPETINPLELRDTLFHSHHIECAITHAGGKPFLRVSTGIFNTQAELDRLARAVSELSLSR